MTNQEKIVFQKINMSRTSAITISKSIKYYIKKKKYYILKIKENPSIIHQSRFLKLCAQNQSWVEIIADAKNMIYKKNAENPVGLVFNQ